MLLGCASVRALSLLWMMIVIKMFTIRVNSHFMHPEDTNGNYISYSWRLMRYEVDKSKLHMRAIYIKSLESLLAEIKLVR